jgi:hypothetical protein
MSRGPIDLWTRTPRSIAPFSASAPSHHNLSSVDFITNIAESNFRYTHSDPTKDPEFQKVVRHFLSTPPQPHKTPGKRKATKVPRKDRKITKK